MQNKKALLIILGVLGVLGVGYLVGRFSYVLQSADSVADLVWCLILLCAVVPSLASQFGAAQLLKYGGAWAGIFIVVTRCATF